MWPLPALLLRIPRVCAQNSGGRWGGWGAVRLWGLTASFYPASSLSNWQQVSQETLTANSRRFLAPPSLRTTPLLKPPFQTPVCLCHAYAAHTACNEFALTSRKESSGKIQCASLAYNTHSVTIFVKHQSMFTFSLSDDLFLNS